MPRRNADAAKETVHGKADQAADRAHAQWQSFKADTSAKMQQLQELIERKRGERDGKAAQKDTERAEDNAADALDYAGWAIDQAELAVLDAAAPRAWADARAAGVGRLIQQTRSRLTGRRALGGRAVRTPQ